MDVPLLQVRQEEWQGEQLVLDQYWLDVHCVQVPLYRLYVGWQLVQVVGPEQLEQGKGHGRQPDGSKYCVVLQVTQRPAVVRSLPGIQAKQTGGLEQPWQKGSQSTQRPDCITEFELTQVRQSVGELQVAQVGEQGRHSFVAANR